MNYLKIYNQLIDRGQKRQLGHNKKSLVSLIGYIEKHHIVPRCRGGDNNKDNLVFLTAREHYIAHRLLVNIYPNTIGLLAAVMFFCEYGNSKGYATVRKQLSEIKKGKVAWNKGKEFSPETCAKMANGSRKGKNHPQFGTHRSEETIEKIRSKQKGKVVSAESTAKWKASYDPEKHGKKVSCDGVIYGSMREASMKLFGIKSSDNIRYRCNSAKYPTFFLIDTDRV